MNTMMMLAACYDGKPVIPIDVVCRDFFMHLTPQKLLRKVSDGSIALPLLRMEESQKSAKGVHVSDLAHYIDLRREEALREHRQLHD